MVNWERLAKDALYSLETSYEDVLACSQSAHPDFANLYKEQLLKHEKVIKGLYKALEESYGEE